MGTHLGKRLNHRKGKEDNSITKSHSERQKQKLCTTELSPLLHEKHELNQDNGNILPEKHVNEDNCIYNEIRMSTNHNVPKHIPGQSDNTSEVSDKDVADYEMKLNTDTTDKVRLERDNLSLNDVRIEDLGLKINDTESYADSSGSKNADKQSPETFKTDLHLRSAEPDVDLATVDIENSKNINQTPENTHHSDNKASEIISLKSVPNKLNAKEVKATVENNAIQVDNEHSLVEHDSSTVFDNTMQSFSPSVSTIDAVTNGESNVIYNDQDVKHIDKMQKVKSMKMKKIKSVSDSDCSKDKKIVDPVLQNLEILLNSMNSDNIDWAKSTLELSKCVRACIKIQEKEMTALLVKNQIAEKFLSFLDIIKVELVAKLSNEDIESLTSWTVYKRFLTLFWIMCDGSVNFCQYFLTSRVFEYLTMELRVLSTLISSLCDKSLYLLKAILGIYHNICRHIPSSKWVFRNEGLVSVLRIFLGCDIPMVRVKTLIILSYVTSETENEIINADDENFQFIIEVLTDALNSEGHKSLKYGMNAAEILKGLCNLAVNDENKIRMVKNGVLPLYEKFLENGTKEEKKLTVTALWSLAFHHYNKQKMRDMTGIMEKLRSLEFPENYSDDDEICHAARGTIWELENTSVAAVDRNYSSSSELKDANLPHIMISYQWDCQSIMVKVKDKLRQAGYKVWMDVEHMTGSTLEAMALAVERAAVILICMSQKYKDSPNCRTEAEYVYRLHKDFVPLRLQQDYIPDGWLGIMVGTRLYFDVYSEDKIDRQIPALVKELRDRGRISPVFEPFDQGMIIPTRMTSREAVPLLPSRSSEIASWSHSDVQSWLSSVGCQDLINRLPTLDGPLLTELQHIQTKAPEFFYTCLKSEFDFTVTEVLKFSKCLRTLT